MINLDRVLTQMNPEMLIADGSNYRSYVSRWQKTGQQKKSLFTQLAKRELLFFITPGKFWEKSLVARKA